MLRNRIRIEEPVFLERLTDQELIYADVDALRKKDHDLRTDIKNEERKRYLNSIDKWLNAPIPSDESERISCLDQYNEIIRKGVNDHNEYLINSWYNLSRKADKVAIGLPDCATTAKYGNAPTIVDALIFEKLGREETKYGRVH